MSYGDKLNSAIRNNNSVLCVGLDPDLELIPASLKHSFSDYNKLVENFCKKIIDVTSTNCAAYKPNLAFFEALGQKGLEVFKNVCEYIPNDTIIIADGKRGDIKSTAEHYCKAYFEKFDVDALTVNPLMGFDTLSAFRDYPDKALYILTLTSNEGADDFLLQSIQDYSSVSSFIADRLKNLQKEFNTHLGMVIGATQTRNAVGVLDSHSKANVLIPGVGSQGGSIEKLRSMLDRHEGLPLINSSRSIIYAGSDQADWQIRVRNKVKKLNKELQQITEVHVK